MPKGAKPRNLLADSAEMTTTRYWRTATQGGVTQTVAPFTESATGERYVHAVLVGTPTAGGTKTVYTADNIAGFIPVAPGDVIRLSFTGRIPVNTAKVLADEGLRADLQAHDAAKAPIAGGGATGLVRGSGWSQGSLTFTVSDPAVKFLRLTGIGYHGAAGSDIAGIEYDIKRPQLTVNDALHASFQPTDAGGFPLTGYGPVRNRAVGAQGAAGSSWTTPTGATVNGMALTYLSSGVDPGRGIFHRYALAGTATNSGLVTLLANLPHFTYADRGYGRPLTLSAAFRLVSGVLTAGNGGSLQIIEREGATAVNTALLPEKARDTAWKTLVQTVDTARPAVNSLAVNIGFAIATGVAVDIVMDFAELQAENGLTATPPQRNHGPLDVTEPAVADVWYLSNDGGDSLPASLPAGSYGVATLDSHGGIRVESVTLANAGPVELLRSPQLRDAVVVAGPWGAGEEAALLAYWERIAAWA